MHTTILSTAPTSPMPVATARTRPGTALHIASAEPARTLQELSPETAWQQVLARDAAADGRFVYAVQSTGIFCRPSCPSRRPDRSRVMFFASPAEAIDAGFRPCLRCRPEDDATAPHAADAAIVAAAMRHFEQHGAERVDLASLSAAVGRPKAAIRNAFRRTLGTTPARFARERRIESFRRLLVPHAAADSSPRITDAIYDAGFSSSSRLYERSIASLGMTPSALRAGAPGTRIRYALADSPLGRTLVAATDRGICAISFADTDGDLCAELRGRFPRAQLEPVNLAGDALAEPLSPSSEPASAEHPAAQAQWLVAAVHFVLRHLSEHPAAAAFPLDVRATAFQQRVWQALVAIPRGNTVSYAALAVQLGQPTGARAVAGACARNPVALAIPCHRVVSGSGAMAGYRWGIDRKRTILAAEAAVLRSPAAAHEAATGKARRSNAGTHPTEPPQPTRRIGV